MKNAYDQRQGWKKALLSNSVPWEALYHIIEYKKMSEDKTFRASARLEALGEMALLWFEQNHGSIPPDFVEASKMSGHSLLAGYALKINVADRIREELGDADYDDFTDEIIDKSNIVDGSARYMLDGGDPNQIILVILTEYRYEYYADQNTIRTFEEHSMARHKLKAYASKNMMESGDNDVVYFSISWYNAVEQPEIFEHSTDLSIET